ncbi:MAG: RDD family protein [Dehalococcoidia bacterium]|jgi:uncharacterized RDD family membrane protein YckC|nr:hypothetical protein [Chloroflexota bacterium]MDP6272710.1 RDD family protein [Dehalococcoidia bacterium]|tara:strand:- start:248 stop:850 length:603 start_codon:yes stop_codon:yes gene_type:complete
MPGVNFCRECGNPVPAVPGERARTYDPSGYSPSSLTSDGGAIPGQIAGMSNRTGAWLITSVAVSMIGSIPFLGWIVQIAAFIWTMFLYQRGQDVGARIVGLRVVRDTGELAGFYHMWTRGLAALVSFFALGAGFWTAYFDNDNQTWHDKWLGTYVVKAGSEVDNLPGTSSSAAKTWFWISITVFPFALVVGVVALILLLA